MRIAFVGKGGSGKTTLAALFARYVHAQGYPVLCIDADINQHLAVALGMSEDEAGKIPALGLNIPYIKEYLRGVNARIASTALMAKTTPPGGGSRLIRQGENNQIFEKFVVTVQGIRVMVTGPFAEEDLGVSCYHAKTGAVELLLNHLVDGEKEYVVVDMTAGADSFASGLFTKFDLTVIVTEPTRKSISVLEQYQKYCAGFNVALAPIGNKVMGDEDVAFFHTAVPDMKTYFTQSSYVQQAERGVMLPLTELEPDNKSALRDIHGVLDAQKKDWKKYLQQTNIFHQKNAESWANVAYGVDLVPQIDPNFSYPA